MVLLSSVLVSRPLNEPYLINNLSFYSGGCHVGKVSSELSYSYRDIGIPALAKLQSPCASAGLRGYRLVRNTASGMTVF